jgi:hypothetical protein
VNRVFLTTGHDFRDLRYCPAGKPPDRSSLPALCAGIFAVIGGIGAIISAPDPVKNLIKSTRESESSFFLNKAILL